MNKLDEYLAILENARRYSWEEFAGDPERYGSVERFLHLSLEALQDMGNHVIADLELGFVNRSRDIPEIFAKQGWINEGLKEKWIRMIGFRNILVHDYLEVDRRIVYEMLQNRLVDLKQIRDVFVRFL
ncbi:MAG: DUF86 domain-containing protein [Rhodothermales bacterium]